MSIEPVPDLSCRLEFSATVWTWRGPAPFYFVTVPDAEAEVLQDLMRSVTYGWGMIPASVHIGRTTWETALWPKDGSYVVPLKARIRKAEEIDEGDDVAVELVVGGAPRDSSPGARSS